MAATILYIAFLGLVLFSVIGISLWTVTEILYIAVLFNNMRKNDTKHAKKLLEIDYPKLYYIIESLGYFDN